MKKILSTLSFILLIIAFTACKPSTNRSTDAENADKLSQEEIEKGISEVIFPLPEPVGVYQMLEEIGAVYNGKTLNPVASGEKYFTSDAKAVNIGVFAADLSYTMVYEKTEDSDSYSQALKKLIDALNIKVDYVALTSDEAKQKAANTDSLVKMTTQVFYDIYEFLYKESDPALAALMVNGFYIEGLYIATHISKDTYNNVEMVKIIYGQAKPLEELIKLNEKFLTNEYLKAIQGSLLKLKAMYDATDGSLTKEQLKQITTTVEAIRDSMVS